MRLVDIDLIRHVGIGIAKDLIFRFVKGVQHLARNKRALVAHLPLDTLEHGEIVMDTLHRHIGVRYLKMFLRNCRVDGYTQIVKTSTHETTTDFLGQKRGIARRLDPISDVCFMCQTEHLGKVRIRERRAVDTELQHLEPLAPPFLCLCDYASKEPHIHRVPLVLEFLLCRTLKAHTAAEVARTARLDQEGIGLFERDHVGKIMPLCILQFGITNNLHHLSSLTKSSSVNASL